MKMRILILLTAGFLLSADASQVPPQKKKSERAAELSWSQSLINLWQVTHQHDDLGCGCVQAHGDHTVFNKFFYTLLEKDHPSSTTARANSPHDLRLDIISNFFTYLSTNKIIISATPYAHHQPHPRIDNYFKNHWLSLQNKPLKKVLNKLTSSFDSYACTMESIINNHSSNNYPSIELIAPSIEQSAEFHHVSGALNTMISVWEKRVINSCGCVHIKNDRGTIYGFLSNVIFNHPEYDESLRKKIIEKFFHILGFYKCVFDEHPLAENYHPINNSTIVLPWKASLQHANNPYIHVVIDQFNSLAQKNSARFQENKCAVAPNCLLGALEQVDSIDNTNIGLDDINLFLN